MKKTFLVIGILLTASLSAVAADSLSIQNLVVEHASWNRGSASLLASGEGFITYVLSCANSVHKSMQVLYKSEQKLIQKTFTGSDFYCQDVARLTAGLKARDKIKVKVEIEDRPSFDNAAQKESVITKVEIVREGDGLVNNYDDSWSGGSARWSLLP